MTLYQDTNERKLSGQRSAVIVSNFANREVSYNNQDETCSDSLHPTDIHILVDSERSSAHHTHVTS